MKYDLESAKAILQAFLNEFKKMQEAMSQPFHATSFRLDDKMPEFSADEPMPIVNSFLEKETAYGWLYAEPWHFRALMHRPKSHPVPEYYLRSALPIYLQWRSEEKEVFHRQCAMIPPPNEPDTLADYIQQLALIVSEQNEHRDVWIESLRCFLQFLKEDTDLDQQGALEVIFPSKMELRKGYSLQRKAGKIEKVECQYILRRIDDAVYPIDIFAASEILQNLANVVLTGRPNSQRSAAEALGFAWLCLSVGFYRLTTREEIVFSTLLTALKSPDSEKRKDFFHPECHIEIRSLFGVIDVPISKTICNFLRALPREPLDDAVNVTLGLLPKEECSDKILKYERSIQKSIFQNLFLLKKLQGSF